MNKAQELREKAQEINDSKVDLTKENTQEAINFFVSLAESCAEHGSFYKNTSCLINKQKGYHCQTENDGGGFTIYNLKDVISGLRELGFEVETKLKDKGYSELNLKW